MKEMQFNKTPEIYYLARRGHYYRQTTIGKWDSYNKDDTRLFLKSCGFDCEIPDRNKMTEIDRYILQLQTDKRIDDVVSLAGYSKGIHQFANSTVLVTDSPLFLEPVKGDYSLIDRLTGDVLGIEQQQHFYAWLQTAIRNLRDKDYSARGQTTFFVGPKRSCKSLMQDLITKVLGGRAADPHQYLMGESSFNAELFGAEHLKIEDKAGQDFEHRGAFSMCLKGFIANTSHNRHEKGHTPASYSPKWRITVSLNDDYTSLKIIPLLDAGMEDKINIYKCTIPDLSDVLPYEVISNEQLLFETFSKQLPAFIYFLLNDFQVDKNFLATRFGIKAFHNAEIISLTSMSPMLNTLNETLENALCLDRGLTIGYCGKAGDFMDFFKLTGANLDSSFNGSRTFGRRLTEICKVKEMGNKVVVKNNSHNIQTYLIANDIKHPALEQFNIKEIMQTVKAMTLKDNHYPNQFMFRKSFEEWVDQNK